jgi:hypothetical protein
MHMSNIIDCHLTFKIDNQTLIRRINNVINGKEHAHSLLQTKTEKTRTAVPAQSVSLWFMMSKIIQLFLPIFL